MIYGLDHLGGAKYADLALREHPSGWAFGIFYDTFGNSLSLIDKVAKSGRAPIIRVHGIWKDDHRFSRKDFTEAVKKAQNLEKLARANPNCDFRYSPFCEHNLNAADMNEAFRLIRLAAPSLGLVNTPLHNNKTIIDDAINEFHGAEKKPRNCKRFQFSFDGKPAEDSDVETFKANYKNSEVFFLWSPRFNGRWEDIDKTPRPQRRGWPDSDLVDSIIYLASMRGDLKLSRDHLFKSHSENKGKKDPRAEKPVYICPVKARSVELVARNGQVVDILKYYGVFTDGRHRYYSTTYGYQTSEKARRIQGDPLVQVKINNKFYGVVNPAFRFGGFR